MHQTYPELADRIPRQRRIIDFRGLLILGYVYPRPERIWDYAVKPELAGEDLCLDAGTAEAHCGGDLHLVHIEPCCAGMDDVHRLVQ